jgi:poly(3-hydroxybutyrate) depolymerase
MRDWVRALALIAVTLSAAPMARGAEPLPSFNVEIGRSSVSGLSSGGYMAGQFHVAFSEILVGVGIAAGGPYFCAEGSLTTALNRCMQTGLGEPDASRLVGIAETLADQGEVDDLANLPGDRVYIFAGGNDETVLPTVVDKTREFYELAGLPGQSVVYVAHVPAGHAMITEDFGGPCPTTESPYINDCDYDQAGAILWHIYGPLAPPAANPGGQIIEFDQSEFITDPTEHGMNELGYAYVPAACGAGEPCRVHIAFHGCRQTTEHVDDAFYRHAGYNEWADANDLIVLYPQAFASPGNPRGCWDWWGYDDPDYHTKEGRQMAAVKRMLDRLAETEPPFCATHTAINFDHWQEDRAHACGFWSACANGSDDALGFLYDFVFATTVFEAPRGYFSTRPCAE